MRLHAQKISFYELPQAVEVSYEGDKALLQKYHVAPNMTLKQCVMETMKMIFATSKHYQLSYYKVLNEKKCIGYIVVFDEFLYSFGLNIKSRTKEIKEAFWQEIKELLGDRFAASLYDNNFRACKYLENQGMIIITHDKENHLLIFGYDSNKIRNRTKSSQLYV